MRQNYIPAVLAVAMLAAPSWAALSPQAPQSGFSREINAESAWLLAANDPPGSPASRAEERHHYGDWLRQNRGLPPAEQEKRLQSDPYFQKLPPERQQQLLQRLQHFNSLPPERQQRILNRMEMIERLPPEKQEEIHQVFHQFRQLDPERKRLMFRTLRQMRGMPPAARERFLSSQLTESHFTKEEMNMLRVLASIGFGSH
jgi:hypothetical protein